MKDYYKILGVDRSADATDIKKAYRRLAVQYHPDKNPGDKAAEEKFKEVTEAYQVLSDPEKKRMFDNFGSAGPGGFHPGGFGGAGGGGPYQQGFDFNWSQGGPSPQDIFNDIFGDIFGGAGPGRGAGAGFGSRQRKGADLKYTLNVSLEDVANGCTRLISFIRQRSGKEDQARLSVNVPAGVKHGQRLKLSKEGDTPVNGGEAGDLYVVVHLNPHPLFERRDKDLLMELPLSFVDAILGKEVKIPTLSGVASLKVPPGTSAGQMFRLKNKGFPALKGSSRGDMLVKVAVDVPKDLSKSEVELVKKLSNIADNAPKVREFNSKMDMVLKARST